MGVLIRRGRDTGVPLCVHAEERSRGDTSTRQHLQARKQGLKHHVKECHQRAASISTPKRVFYAFVELQGD
jgi:hypothetical protein